jgi:hypothetical protein
METKSPVTRVGARVKKRIPIGLPLESKVGGLGGENLLMALCSKVEVGLHGVDLRIEPFLELSASS